MPNWTTTRRWLATLFISGYLGALAVGVAAHAVSVGTSAHPLCYFFVWDMFCGWASHEIRYHVIAEGESGQYYTLCPAPWGDFGPFHDLPRHHYDAMGIHFGRMGANTLRNTVHEPMLRMLVIEENWSKKFNLPDELWAIRHDVPKDPLSYYWHWQTYSPEGDVIQVNNTWLAEQGNRTLFDNPRLVRDSLKGQSFQSYVSAEPR